MTDSGTHRSKKSYRKSFIILPIVFLLIGYLLFFICLTPILSPLVSIYELAFSNANVNTIVEPGENSAFNGGSGVDNGYLTSGDITFPSYGDHFGHITVEGTDIDTDVIFGDDTSLLKKGACMSYYSHIPGCGRGVLIGAHNNTYFHSLQDVQTGALVNLSTTYGNFVYRVYLTNVINVDTDSSYRAALNGDKETLILYTCYPNNTLSLTPYRFIAYCEKVSGPHVNMYE